MQHVIQIFFGRIVTLSIILHLRTLYVTSKKANATNIARCNVQKKNSHNTWNTALQHLSISAATTWLPFCTHEMYRLSSYVFFCTPPHLSCCFHCSASLSWHFLLHGWTRRQDSPHLRMLMVRVAEMLWMGSWAHRVGRPQAWRSVRYFRWVWTSVC